MRRALLAAGLLVVALSRSANAGAPHPDLPDPNFSFKTFFVTWGNTASPQLVEFLKEARPEVVQLNFYGPMFHGYADNPLSTGYPMQLPVAGQREALASQKKTIDEVHKLGLKVVSHFQMVNVIHDPAKPEETFVGFYNNRWPEDLLGKRPGSDYRELLQRDGKGEPFVLKHYVDNMGLCLNSPPAKEVHRRMLKLAIDQGVDGIVANYNYYWGCACQDCQGSFKKYLGAHYTPDELRERCGIADLAGHRFDKIPAATPGYPDVKTATELDWAAHRWAGINFKENFDELFIGYGRKLKPDLIVATWNHIGDVGITEERAFTPIEAWGKGENYFWYSGGHAPSDLKKRYAADAWLTSLYIRELSASPGVEGDSGVPARGKPFMMGKYDGLRPRMNIAEGVATGGGGMGLQIAFMDPVGREAATRYLKFVHANRELYDATPRSEVALVLPRQSTLAGQPQAQDTFRVAGTDLVRKQVLFDVVADQKLSAARLSRYAAVVLPQTISLTPAQMKMLEEYLRAGGNILAIGPIAALNDKGGQLTASTFAGVTAPATQPAGSPATQPVGKGRLLWLAKAEEDRVAPALDSLCHDRLTHISAPWTLRAAAYEQPGRMILHLVNFNRDEDAAKALPPATASTPAAELPIAARDVKVSVVLKSEAKVAAVTLLSPDEKAPQTLPFSVRHGHVEFAVPSVLVYAVIRVDFSGG